MAILVLIVAVVGATGVDAALKSLARVRHVRTALNSLDHVSKLVTDAESAQRGFLITHDRSCLKPFEKANDEIDGALDSVRSSVAASEMTRNTGADVDELALAVHAKMAEMRRMIDLADRGMLDQALAAVNHGQDQALREKVNAQVAKMLHTDDDAREAQSQLLRDRLGWSRYVIVAGAGLGVFFAILLNLSIWRAFQEGARAQDVVERQSAVLRTQTERLLHDERQLEERLHESQRLSSQLTAANDALARTNGDLDQFAYATSHDLKAPLRGITNLATWVEEDLGDAASATVKEHLTLLRSRAHRLELLIDGILAYSRAGRATSKVEPIDVHALVTDVVELVAPPANVQISVNGAWPHIVSERAPLQQLFMNLVQNAIKHGCIDGGRVEISAAPDGANHRYSVRDFGAGIDAKYHTRIFGVFQTLVSRDRVEGTGIGLAVVKKLAESRGGTATVVSAPGEGATFSFTWPDNAASSALDRTTPGPMALPTGSAS